MSEINEIEEKEYILKEENKSESESSTEEEGPIKLPPESEIMEDIN